MKYLLTEQHYQEKDHIFDIIQDFLATNHRAPDYVIVHPLTSSKLHRLFHEQESKGERERYMNPIQIRVHGDTSHSIYDVPFIRSEDVEVDFIIIT